jgi:hypothetical protein
MILCSRAENVRRFEALNTKARSHLVRRESIANLASRKAFISMLVFSVVVLSGAVEKILARSGESLAEAGCEVRVESRCAARSLAEHR